VKVLLLLMLLAGLAELCPAQTPAFTIKGTVEDSLSGGRLEGATCTLMSDSGIATQHRRNTRLGFVFRAVAPGQYQLITSYLGYKPDTMVIVSPARLAKDSTQKLIIRLQRSATNMMQVVVTARIPPAIVKNDTIAFNAGAYPTRPNATVEDLLRKLPGVEIDNDGNVTMQGKKIDKIYLDGKEFFLNDPRIASQNLPADIVDQIEAFDSQSDRAKLTGIKEMSKTKSINIKLKKSRRRGFLGKVYAGVGEGNNTTAYAAGGTATYLGPTLVFGTANVNNINNQFTGQENRNGPGAGGVQKFNNLELNFSNNGNRYNNNQSLPGNPSKENQPAFIFTLNGGTNGNHTTLNQSSSTQTTLTDSSLLQQRTSRSTGRSQSTHANSFLEYKIDSSSLINLRSSLFSNNSNNNSTDTVSVATLQPHHSGLVPLNRGQTINSSQTTSWNLSNGGNYRWRGHDPSQNLVIEVNQSTSRQHSPLTTYSLVSTLDSLGNTITQTLTHERIQSTATSNTVGTGLSYTQPLSKGHLLDASYHLDRSVNRNDQIANDYDSLTGAFDRLDSATTNHFTTTNAIQRASLGYDATEGKFRYRIGGTVQATKLDNRNRSTDSTLIIKQTNWYPHASLLYTFKSGTNLNLQYGANTITPSIQQLQPVADPTNPFLIRIGNPDLHEALVHTLNLEFNSFNGRNFENWQAAVHGNLIEHAITSATTILSGGIQQVEFVNTSGNWSAGGNLNYGFPIGDQRKGNGSVGANADYTRSTTIVNNGVNKTAFTQCGAIAKVNFHPTQQLFVEAQGNLSYAGSSFEPNTAQPTTTWTQTYSLDAAYTFPANLTLTSWFRYQSIQGVGPLQQTNQWNASMAKDLGNNHAAEVRFSAFGLLSAARNAFQNTTANVTTITTSSLPGRTLLVSFIYHFHRFNTAKPS
jgi:Outer membrane protein beta-barrel family